jgi:hypothetical protein
MKIWVAPEPELIDLRDTALAMLREHPSCALAAHWAMVAAAYPFWFNVALQTGRLLNLQDQVTQSQIVNRLKGQYGDRQTVSRYARFVIRSFVAWGVLIDSAAKGCYGKAELLTIADQGLVLLLFESALQATPEGKSALGLLSRTPAFFPFQLPIVTGDLIAQRAPRIEVVRYGLDDELLKLKEVK